jgi:hypothetical protein
MLFTGTRNALAHFRFHRLTATRYASTKPSADNKAFSNTLLLPKTSFSQWPDLETTEAVLRTKTCDDLYRWQVLRPLYICLRDTNALSKCSNIMSLVPHLCSTMARRTPTEAST